LIPTLAACTGGPLEDVRRPCPDAVAWDPNRPLALRWGDDGLVEMNEHVARRISASSGLPLAPPKAAPCVLDLLGHARPQSHGVVESTI